ncbi:NAD(P)-binding protein [Hymenopellis radicata]|nr:NAD(P)-binding protein [Hymenopellis radicata]
MRQGTAVIKRCTQSSFGRAVALQLGNDGFDIALAEDASQETQLASLKDEIELKGVRCRSYFCDAAKEDEIKQLIEDVVADFGGIDVVVANNLVVPTVAPLLGTSVDEWDDTFRVTARFAFVCFKYAAQQMIKQGRGGRLICVNTIMGLDGGFLHNMSAVTSASFAIRGLVQAAALELGPHNITVNSYACGPAPQEEMTGRQLGSRTLTCTPNTKIPGASAINRLAGIETSRDIREMLDNRVHLPRKRMNGRDVAQVVSLLASKEADFITGQTVCSFSS